MKSKIWHQRPWKWPLDLNDLKICNFKSLTRKLSYSSIFPAWSTDLKNVTFEKIHWPPSEVIEVKRSFSRLLRPNFRSHLFFTGLKIKTKNIKRFETLSSSFRAEQKALLTDQYTKINEYRGSPLTGSTIWIWYKVKTLEAN